MYPIKEPQNRTSQKRLICLLQPLVIEAGIWYDGFARDLPAFSGPTLMATIKDVARECGVSANTVSSVLNNKPGEVSAKTRERILEAMRRLDYRPNAAARRMVGKRLNTIGIADRYVDSTGMNNYYKTTIMESVLFAARRDRWDVLYYSGHPSEEQVSNFPAYLDGRCDGLLCFTGGITQEEATAIIKTGLPVVFVGTTPYNHGGAVIDVDNEQGGYFAASHLLDLGHTRIGMLQSNITSGNAERTAGLRRAMAERNISVEERFFYSGAAWEGSGYELGSHISSLPESERPTAIFGFNDGMAIGLMKALQASNIRVPEQISVVGFDDTIPSASALPPLTTVRQPLTVIGQRAAEILIAIIDGVLPRDYSEIATPELIVRSSTTPPSLF